MADQAKGKKPIATMNKFAYDAFLWTFSILVELFFREVHPRSGWKVPKEGPVIFVCAPHANQVGHLFPAFARSTPEANKGSSSTL
jgi:glycerol-3-phosphate O-acyltransferase/dihydroxyacetone phosphate acyltransferase